MSVRLNAAVRITPPTELCDHWAAENLLLRRRYKLSREAAAVLVAACRPRERGELAGDVSEKDGGGRAVGFWSRMVDGLCRHDLLVDTDTAEMNPRRAWLTELRANWSRYGWHEAAEYHALTFDYPCLDYTEAAAAISTDQARMRGYQHQEPDNDRFKLDYADRPGIGLPGPAADMPTGSARAVWDEPLDGVPVTFENLATVLSLAFGSTGTRIPRTDAAPLLRRSSPSGGGRHPSEGYVAVRDVPGIAPGWYHVTMQPFSLRRLGGLGDGADGEAALRENFPETMPRFPFDVKALVVLTSVFERNMYRYREPRTFRTVHMDAGHIAGTLRIAARSVGLTAGVYYCDAAERIERTLGIDGMREGYMLTVAVADGAHNS
jgi:SagB-type dehydrogenase family enzyme